MPRALVADHGPDDAGLADIGADASHLFEQVLGLDGFDDGLDGGTGQRPRTEGGAQRIHLHRGGDLVRHHQGRAGEAIAQRLRGGDHVRRDAIHVGGEGIAGAADAALHFIEDQHGARGIAALAQGPQVFGAQIERTAHALDRFDDDGRGALGDLRGYRRSRSSRGMNVTSNGARGKPYQVFAAPQVSAPAAAVRPWKPCSSATTCGAARHAERHLQCVLIGLGAAVDEEHGIKAQPREAHQPIRGAQAHVHGHRVALELAGTRLLGDRTGPARVTVAQRRDGMAAIQIQHAAPVAGVQPDAFGGNHRQRILGEDLGQMIGQAGRGDRSGKGGICVHDFSSSPASLGPTGRRRQQAAGLGQVKQPVHPLHGAAGGALGEIVERRTSRRRCGHWPPRTGARSCSWRRSSRAARHRSRARKASRHRTPAAYPAPARYRGRPSGCLAP